ncbi:MAG: type I restriction enzyme HsdR N-terminal domain-containing protein [Bacteroidetes bacterium]|jgi:hypothetical protein|nr:type I restriction enzyme HsdR N-terminal domain-containing protein [Bacteroidota bacterium]MBT6684706.1 type I restriction enzyme HsdR N-terminal domain-containing protein [Bacteroidota bacterium]MBT7143169.1 type I restriction enzyme HsdR N-terminal domain-containing protein [Bacteroidota bacterium]MBT7492612.1 type I restriction enzyme HsdR N-terminal domain-containing protein [Bacteroidota bacterium]
MQSLNLPNYNFRYKLIDDRKYIFDQFRKKYVALTPEEWVRQNFVNYLIDEKKFPQQLITIEMFLSINKMKRRCDIAVFDKFGKALLIVECKSPKVKISQNTFEQIANYNIKLKVNYLIVTNGLSHYCCKIDHSNNSYKFLQKIPEYEEIKNKE